MINEPISVVGDGFQRVWRDVVLRLAGSQWELRNLIVQIKNPNAWDQPFHEAVEAFAKAQNVLGPKHVAYTIFPHGLQRDGATAADIFAEYNKPRGLYERLQHRKPGWGTYFRRMTHYDKGGGQPVNQLANIITALRDRQNLSKAAYTIVIQNPGGETVRPLGGPCLNYVAVQAEPGQNGQSPTLGILAVYRNHDFLERAYGNYWGLCNLLRFVNREVGSSCGPLTCVSSHAYASGKKTALKQFVEGL